MASCKDCSSIDLCGFVFDKRAEINCDGFDYAAVDENNDADKTEKTKCVEAVAPSTEWLKEKETEETTLKIKAVAYSVIKDIMGKKMHMDFSSESCFDMVSGVILMGEAVTKALIK